MKFCKSLPVLVFLLFASLAMAETPQTGPVIEGFGPVFSVPDGSFNLEAGKAYKVVMDVGKGPDNPAELNRSDRKSTRLNSSH